MPENKVNVRKNVKKDGEKGNIKPHKKGIKGTTKDKNVYGYTTNSNWRKKDKDK